MTGSLNVVQHHKHSSAFYSQN